MCGKEDKPMDDTFPPTGVDIDGIGWVEQPPEWLGRSSMSFIQRELDRVRNVLRQSPPVNNYAELYAVQEALVWALDPDGFKAPYDMLVPPAKDILEGSEGCLAKSDHLSS